VRIAWGKPFFAAAETMGTAFPSLPFVGIIHSVFPHALNLLSSTDGHIYTLITRTESLYARGVLIKALDFMELDFKVLGLESGQAVFSDQDGITFDCGKRVSFLGAKRTHAALENPPVEMIKDLDLIQTGCDYLACLQDTAHTELQWKHLASLDPQESPFLRRFHSAAWSLKISFTTQALDTAISAGKNLIGFGPGLTPTGDDFLCGFALAAYGRSTFPSKTPDFIPKPFITAWLSQILDNADSDVPRTNEIALSFLTLAAAGKFSYGLVRLADAFKADNNQRVSVLMNALKSLGHYGHSSGLDAATGFFFGLSEKIPHSS
jgi:hypothetical protein